MAGTADVAAFAGWTWDSGEVSPFLLTSADRHTWTPERSD